MLPQPPHDSERLRELKAQWEQTQPFEIHALAEEIRARSQAQEAAAQQTTRTRTLGLMVSLSVALLLLMIFSISAFLQSRAAALPGTNPTATVQDFWRAMEGQNYQDAYRYFTLDVKNSMSIDQFITEATALDRQQGVVTNVILMQASGDSQSRRYTYQVTRQHAGLGAEQVQLLFDSGTKAWEIASLSGKAITVIP
jgi:hypothetical protein